MRLILISLTLVASLAFAGCATSSSSSSNDGAQLAQPDEVQATETTGGIHGIVVDQAIRPIAKAVISVGGPTKKNTTTDDQGTFVINGLLPGTYLLKASKPLYDNTQQTVEVVAGVRDPKDVKVQLNQVVFSKPYLETVKFIGFIACSQDFNGQLFSEECGEGVGVPGVGRVGGQADNKVLYNFFPSVNAPQSMIVEDVWTPTIGAATTGALWTIVAKDFVCDPFCGGTEVMNYQGASFGNCATSPSYIRNDANVQKLNLTSATQISTFTWACGKGGVLPYDLEFQQKFEEFVTMSYVLPLPADWSFVRASPNPFK